MPDFSLKTKLNENNIQAPFQYKPAEDEFILNEISDEIELNNDNVQVKFFNEQKLFCVDFGYSIDGEITEMTFAIDKIKVFPTLLNSIKELKSVEVRDNAIYFVDDTNFKSIAFLPKTDYGKVLSFTITTYASTFSSFMFDEIAKKINSLDTDFPIRNFYPDTDYKENDIIKKDGYLYKVITNFTSNDTLTNSIILTPFRRREDSTPNMYDLIQDNNQFFIVNSQNGELKPLTSIITWQDTINKIYKNTIIIKEENDKKRKFIVLKDVLNPIWDNLKNDNDIIELYIASDILYNNNEVDNLQDGLDLAFTKIDETNSIISNFNNDLKNDIATKQDKLIMSNNINISDDSIISVKLNNKYDLNYHSYIFPTLSYTIPDEILFKLSLADTDFPATIKKEETKPYIFNCKIDITEEKKSISLNIKDINLIELSQFFIQDKEYELENCILVFKNDMTITIKPILENTNFKISELELNYIFTSIYNKNIYFLTNYGYLVLEQDNKNGIPRGSVVHFVKDFIISQDMIKKHEEDEDAGEMETAEKTKNEENTKQIDYIELKIENDIIAEYFDIIDNFGQLKATNDIYFLRTTKDAEDNETETKTTAKYGLFLNKEEDNKYRLRITRDDKLEILENDILIMNFPPDKNKELAYKDTIAENLDNTIQALTEMDNTIATAQKMLGESFDKKLENETKARETTNNEINQKINNILNVVYPVGSIYITSDNTFNPNGIFKIGKWEKITEENEIEEVNELGEKKENKWERIE